MKKYTIELYKFKELPENIQKKVLEKKADINLMHDWYEEILQTASECGIEILEFSIDRNTIEGKLIENPIDIVKNIKGKANHLITTHNFIPEFVNIEHVDCEKFKEIILSFFFKCLIKEYDFLTSITAIKETIESNDYDFTINGNIFNPKYI